MEFLVLKWSVRPRGEPSSLFVSSRSCIRDPTVSTVSTNKVVLPTTRVQITPVNNLLRAAPEISR